MTDQRSPLLARPGAVEAGGLDRGVAAHYGDPVREQRALVRTPGTVVDLSHKGVVTVTGPDRLSWLTTLSSQVLTGLEPGASTETLFLSVQGRIETAPHVVDDGVTTWLVTEAGETAPLVTWLESMRFALRVEVADRTAEWAVLGAAGPVPGLEAPVVWRDPWPEIGPGGWSYAALEGPHPGEERTWCEHLVPRDRLDAVTRDLPLAGVWAAEALRIAAWRPRWGAETDERTIPHELDLLRTAVHLAKGCYKGQETVARVHNLGHPPRRLALLDLDGSEHTLPSPGADVVAGERTVGRVTSVQLHHEQGPIALAVLKRTVDPAVDLVVTEDGQRWAAAQQVVVAPDAGQVVGRRSGFLRGPRGAHG
ncbi:YgfZ/GcvT domain-containing protein [Kocuria sp. M1R5S2]|uniref:CAF17-like 4Fe-4S cluster assembly/insertion protein YgfZ n=1 Tax=Kocuria rhizosphaerae TaxID=3376285 RepID=UPI0037885B70